MTKNLICVLATLALLMVATVGATVPACAQTYTDLYNFDNTHGSNPTTAQLLAQGRDGNLFGTTPSGGTNGGGVVFEITASGALNVLYNFDGAHGSHPYSGLTLGTDGNFYGTTMEGGANNFGTIFKIPASGGLTTLYSFTGGTDDGFPQAPPIQGTDGNFYGTTANSGTAYKITPAGTYTLLGSLPGQSYAPLLQGTDGNFYGTTWYGGSSGGYGTVFKVTPRGAVTVVYNFDFTHGDAPYGPVVQGVDGNFYGTTFGGGSKTGGVVFKVTPRGAIKPLYNFDGLHPVKGQGPWAGLVQANDGNFYGLTSLGGNVGTGYGVIFKITPAGAYSVLYDFDSTHGAGPLSTPTQHTTGKIYGMTSVGGTSGLGVVYSFDLALAPFVSLVSTSAKVGRTVEILGQGFTGTTRVSFNGTTAKYTVVSDTYLTATVPGGATTGSITVTTPGGTLASNKIFRVTPSIKSFSPASGAVGTPVVISGVSLKQTTKVSFGGVTATSFTVNSDKKVTATVPTGAKTGKIAITTSGGTATSSAVFTVTPFIKSFTPTSGPVGTPVTISGTSFSGATKVTFGGVAATSFTVDSDTQITATVPTGAQTGKIQVTTPAGTATSATDFTVTP